MWCYSKISNIDVKLDRLWRGESGIHELPETSELICLRLLTTAVCKRIYYRCVHIDVGLCWYFWSLLYYREAGTVTASSWTSVSHISLLLKQHLTCKPSSPFLYGVWSHSVKTEHDGGGINSAWYGFSFDQCSFTVKQHYCKEHVLHVKIDRKGCQICSSSKKEGSLQSRVSCLVIFFIYNMDVVCLPPFGNWPLLNTRVSHVRNKLSDNVEH